MPRNLLGRQSRKQGMLRNLSQTKPPKRFFILRLHRPTSANLPPLQIRSILLGYSTEDEMFVYGISLLLIIFVKLQHIIERERIKKWHINECGSTERCKTSLSIQRQKTGTMKTILACNIQQLEQWGRRQQGSSETMSNVWEPSCRVRHDSGS